MATEARLRAKAECRYLMCMKRSSAHVPAVDHALSARATSYDVARLAGVSQSTVSRCFSPDSKISPQTRARVQAIAVRLGYTPNAIARSLILRRSGMVGVLITKQSIQATPDMMTAIGDALAAVDRRLLLLAVEDESAVAAAIGGAFAYPLDGLIACATVGRQDIRSFGARGVPVVLFNRQADSAGVDCVCTDHVEATSRVASLLHEAGHRRFACVGGPLDAPVSRERVHGFVTRLDELGIHEVPVLTADYSYSGGARAFRDYAGNGGRPDAVFCANDQLAMGVLDTCRFTLRWPVPDTLSVVGFDDVEAAGRPSYDLATIRQQLPEMAHAAVALLLARMAARDAPPWRVLVPGIVVPRRSARLGQPSDQEQCVL